MLQLRRGAGSVDCGSKCQAGNVSMGRVRSIPQGSPVENLLLDIRHAPKVEISPMQAADATIPVEMTTLWIARPHLSF